MAVRENYPLNIFVPNLLNICIDGYEHEEMSGRIYHCYTKEPVRFNNIIELIREAEQFFDAIAFPQASTKTRQFDEKEAVQVQKPEKVMNHEEVIAYKGDKKNFWLCVRFRQNSTWQGEFYCVDTETTEKFANIVDFIKKMDDAVRA